MAPIDKRCESPIEDWFWDGLQKYVSDDVTVLWQEPVDTICGSFRLDMLLLLPGGHSLGLEFDGKDHHDPYRDEWRDAMILGTGDVDSIVRLRGTDIKHCLAELLAILGNWYRDIFSSRGRFVLQQLSPRVPDWIEHDSGAESFIVFLGEDCTIPHNVSVKRSGFGVAKMSHAKYLFDYAKQMGGGDLDEVIRSFWMKSLGFVPVNPRQLG